MRLTRRYVISGRVQGVGFRYFTQAAAVREGIDGWVRNTPDGRVEVLGSGAQDALEQFERGLWIGPGGARVSHVEVEILEPARTNSGFVIK